MDNAFERTHNLGDLTNIKYQSNLHLNMLTIMSSQHQTNSYHERSRHANAYNDGNRDSYLPEIDICIESEAGSSQPSGQSFLERHEKEIGQSKLYRQDIVGVLSDMSAEDRQSFSNGKELSEYPRMADTKEEKEDLKFYYSVKSALVIASGRPNYMATDDSPSGRDELKSWEDAIIAGCGER